MEAFEVLSQHVGGLSPGSPMAAAGRLLAALCALGHGVGAAHARSCSGGCSESREAGIWDKTGFVSPAMTSLISSAAGLCSHVSVRWHPPGGCSSCPMAFVRWRPKVLCPHWSLAEDLRIPFLCSLWDWAPWGELPLARAAEEECSARPQGIDCILQGAAVGSRRERVSQCLSGPTLLRSVSGMPRMGTTVRRQWCSTVPAPHVWDPMSGASGGCRAPCIILPVGHPQVIRWSWLGAVGPRLSGGSEVQTVCLAPWEGEESCSWGFGSSLAPAASGLWCGPCTALPPMGTAHWWYSHKPITGDLAANPLWKRWL